MPNIISIGDEQTRPIFIGRSVKKKWPENANDPQDNKYELPIIKYNANKDALVEQKKGTPEHEEEELRTPS
jgi:hypothetical protein